MDIGLALRKLRVRHGYSQQCLADYLEISRNAYIDWENNKVNISLEKCAKICEIYKITLCSFVKDYIEEQ